MATKLFDLAATQRAMLPAEADIDQSVELVQVSADTRSLLAPDWQTAQQKLTGMQFHHFGAFYKRSWRANDWMWGRLDGAGGWSTSCSTHDACGGSSDRRKAEARPERSGSSATQRHSEHLISGGRLPLPAATADEYPDEADLLDELGFLDDPSTPPSSIPKTALWLAQAWQRRVLDEELDGLADTVIDPQRGHGARRSSRQWAKRCWPQMAGTRNTPVES